MNNSKIIINPNVFGRKEETKRKKQSRQPQKVSSEQTQAFYSQPAASSWAQEEKDFDATVHKSSQLGVITSTGVLLGPQATLLT